MTEGFAGITRRQAAIVAGLGLLIMAVLAPIANFYALQGLRVPGDAAATLAKLVTGQALLRGAIGGFLVVAMLDILVAWALYFLFEPVNRSLSLLAAWLRVVYAAMLVGALGWLLQVVLVSGGAAPGLPVEQLAVQTMLGLGSFDQAWSLALGVFGLSLLPVGYLAFRSGFVPKWLGVLLVIAGLGYVVDSLGKLLVPGYSLNVAVFTFVGEPLFMLWLLWRGIRGFAQPAPATIAVSANAAQA